MKLKTVGFFRELRHGEENGSSLIENIDDKPKAYENKLIEYLQNGILFIFSPCTVTDVLSKEDVIIGRPDVLTDGVWAWSGDLAYYIKKYHVNLSDDFINHVKCNNWKVPDEATVNLDDLEF